jgi:hypothetical protein
MDTNNFMATSYMTNERQFLVLRDDILTPSSLHDSLEFSCGYDDGQKFARQLLWVVLNISSFTHTHS